MTTFTIGADPELFVGDKDGNFKSAHDLIPGNKRNPHKVENGAVQVDGMALEFNIDPASSFQEFSNNIESVKETLSSMIGDYEFLEDVSVEFDQNFVKDVPRKNLVLGCEADYCGWTGSQNIPPNPTTMMRTAGGHVHIGGFETDDAFDPDHFDKCAYMARLMDEEVGIPSVVWDHDDRRRSMYGQAGSFRPKTYGMEYRTLSNKWIFNPKLVELVYRGAMRATEKFVKGTHEPQKFIQDVINNSRRDHPLFYNLDKEAA